MQTKDRKRKFRYRIRTRFFIFFSFSVILCALLIAVIAANMYSREISSTTEQSGNELLSNAAGRLEKYMFDLDSMAYPLMLNKTIQSTLNTFNSRRTSDYLTYVAQNNCIWMLQLQGTINPDIEIAVFPLVENERWYSSLTNSRSNYNFYSADWYQRFLNDPALQKQYLPNQMLEIEFSQSPEKTHLICYRIKSLYSLKTVGYMSIYLRPKAIERLLNNFAEDIRNLVLVDDSGEVIYSTGSEFTAEELIGLSEEYAHNDMFYHCGSSFRLLTSDISDTPWKIICTYDLTEAHRAMTRINTIIALVAFIVCLFCMLLLWSFLVRLLKPIEQLTIGMEWVKMGRMDFKLEPERRDELGEAMENFNDMIYRLDQANHELKSMSDLQREIQISALRQQINPHFLYNTLDMIIGMTAEGNSAATIEVCKALGGMFRYNLNGDSRVPLRHELTQIRRYIQISQYRFRNCFETVYSIDESLLDQIVPKLFLQPIVENCVVHGISNISRPASILIAINHSGPDHFIITVKDNGAGMSHADLQILRDSLTPTGSIIEGKHHIGIRNVYNRLYLIYGDQMCMDIESRPSVGTQITILLPIL